jgi:hypothetical protein
MKLRTVAASLLFCATAAGTTSLDGLWRGQYPTDAGCPAYTEIVRVHQDGLYFHATKTVGNACVPRNAVAFHGKLGDTAGSRCFETRGYPVNPYSIVVRCVYARVNADTFRITPAFPNGPTVTFTRITEGATP